MSDGKLPAPLVPKDCDIRDRLPPMPFDTDDLGYGAETWRFVSAAVLATRLRLMAWAWRNNPTGSIPGELEPRVYANAVVMETRAWKRITDKVLAEWVLCSDGRLYHPFLCAEALKIHNRRRGPSAPETWRLEISQNEWLIVRRQVFERDGYVCQYCDTPVDAPQCDHFIPVSAGGLSRPGNLVTSCFPCNSAKRARHPTDFLVDDPARLSRLQSVLRASEGGA